MVTAFQNLQTHGVDHFVLCMNSCMDQNAELETVIFRGSQGHRHVRDIRRNGINMFFIIINIHILELHMPSRDQMNTCPGNQ